ncbi:MAG: 1,4-dihydroxy-2-naphthoate prenyltransferase [Edwardsiella sp. (in: enterobacteria)]
MVLRRLSWMVGSGAWLMPWVLLLWQWLETGQHQAAISPQAYSGWKMTVLLADAAFAGALSLLALLVGAVALVRTPQEALRPLQRMAELLVLALPLLFCLFVLGLFWMHG